MTADGCGAAGGDRTDQVQLPPPPGMALPGFGSVTPTLAAAAAPNTGASGEDPGKKVRKPYTITKSRESWTEQEHDRFLEALELFDRDWKKIEAFVGSKTVIQIRSHAQKYFLKVQKNGTSAHVPPPRPKRKAAHPYPQKASKNAAPLSQATPVFQSSYVLETGSVLKGGSLSVVGNSATGASVASWSQNSVPPFYDAALESSGVNHGCCHGIESPSGTWPASDSSDEGNQLPPLHVTPDFTRVYSFIGSMFDPNTSGHLQKLKEMDPIDVETIVLLMRNLSINLGNTDFEDHRRLLSSYDIGTKERVSCASH